MPRAQGLMASRKRSTRKAMKGRKGDSVKLGEHWGGRYVITAQTTIIVMLLAFYATDYQDVVKKQDLSILAPYRKDEAIIKAHIKESTETLVDVKNSIRLLNERMVQALHESDIRITRLEDRIAP